MIYSFSSNIARRKNLIIITKRQTTRIFPYSSRYFSSPKQQHPFFVAEEILEIHPNNENCTQDDIANALREHKMRGTPVKLRNAVSGTEACKRWSDLDYLKIKVGEDTPCEVEIGADYATGVQRPEILFGDYISYVRMFCEKDSSNKEQLPEPEEMVYLAQNQIFEGLKCDFEIPHLCSDPVYDVGEGKLYSTMIWIGPRGCVSPLHYDPLDNLLMQFTGKKRVWLYPPYPISEKNKGEDWYHAGETGMQYNTSPIDVENVDMGKFPRFGGAPPALEAILYPGDVLFIPKLWWHHVRSMDMSVSVNTWWR